MWPHLFLGGQMSSFGRETGRVWMIFALFSVSLVFTLYYLPVLPMMQLQWRKCGVSTLVIVTGAFFSVNTFTAMQSTVLARPSVMNMNILTWIVKSSHKLLCWPLILRIVAQGGTDRNGSNYFNQMLNTS